MTDSSVDFPQPEAPKSTMNSPGAMSRSISRITWTAPQATCTLRTETRFALFSMTYPFSAPSGMPRTKQRPEAK